MGHRRYLSLNPIPFVPVEGDLEVETRDFEGPLGLPIADGRLINCPRYFVVETLTTVSSALIREIEFEGTGCRGAVGSFRTGWSNVETISAVRNYPAGQLCIPDNR